MSETGIEGISVVGLGKLGSCLAATLANAGFSVVGADLDNAVVERINNQQALAPEPKLHDYISAAGEDLRATTDTTAAVENTDVTFVVVNTPSTEAGRYDLSGVEAACKTIGETLAYKDDYHLVVVTSTVFPGATTGPIKETLEEMSGKTAGKGFGLAYSPEFIAIGNIIDGLESPDFFLIGEHTARAGDVAERIYTQFGQEQTPVKRMSPIEAEITKMAVNSYVTMKISYANTLGQICDGVGGDVDTVTGALALDSRIGGDYLSAGARFGGPCFPRDNVAFSRLAKDAGTEAPLAEATDAVNEQHTNWIAEVVRDATPDDGTVAVLGLSYKPGTYIIEESQGVALLEVLSEGDAGYSLIGFDPMAVDHGRTSDLSVPCYSSLQRTLDDADTAVITVPWEELKRTETYRESSLSLVDPWRVLDEGSLPSSVSYVPIGAKRAVDTPDSERPTRPSLR